MNAGSAGQEPVRFTVLPTFMGNDDHHAPLVGIVSFATNLASTARIHLSGGGEHWTLERNVASTTHEQVVLGLKPDTRYAAQVVLSTGSVDVVAEPALWRSPPLPPDFPPITLVSSDPSRMEPGMTIVGIRDPGYLIVVDDAGDVRWFYQSYPILSYGWQHLRNGNFVFNPTGRRRLVEVDWRGHQVGSWHAAKYPGDVEFPADSVPLPLESLHHSVFEMPNGNLLTLSSEVRAIDGFPTSTTDPNAPTATASVVGDVLVEFTRAGALVKKIALLDLLDPTRVGHGSLDDWWDELYPDSRDWSHSNAVVYDADADAYVISVRHQDAVIKIDRQTESVRWILGTPSNWKEPWKELLLAPTGDLQWQFHQHAVQVTPSGVGMYDNGNFRAAAYEEPLDSSYSRAVRFDVNEEAMTVSQAWSYGAPSGSASFYSTYLSDADYLIGTGNTLITSGGGLRTSTEPPYEYVEVLEVTPTGDIVFRLVVRDDAGDAPIGYTAYDSERVDDIRFSASF